MSHLTHMTIPLSLPRLSRAGRRARVMVVTLLAVFSLLVNVLSVHPGSDWSLSSDAAPVAASPEVAAALAAAGFICSPGEHGVAPDAASPQKKAPCQSCLDCCLSLPPFLLAQSVMLLRHNAVLAVELAAFYQLFLGFAARLRPDVRGPPLLLSS